MNVYLGIMTVPTTRFSAEGPNHSSTEKEDIGTCLGVLQCSRTLHSASVQVDFGGSEKIGK